MGDIYKLNIKSNQIKKMIWFSFQVRYHLIWCFEEPRDLVSLMVASSYIREEVKAYSATNTWIKGEVFPFYSNRNNNLNLFTQLN